MVDAEFIRNRIAGLRTEKGVSARDMSLSIGQSQSYINNIENGKALPSMQMFLYICEFLEIEPMEFFNEGVQCPGRLKEAVRVLERLSPKRLELITCLAREMK